LEIKKAFVIPTQGGITFESYKLITQLLKTINYGKTVTKTVRFIEKA